MYDHVRAKIEKTNERYKAKVNQHKKRPAFTPGDLVWIHLRKKGSQQNDEQANVRAEGFFGVLGKIGNSAYKVELPGDTSVSSTFNVEDLMSYLQDVNLENLRTSFFSEGEDDADQMGSATITNSKSVIPEPAQAMTMLPALSHYLGEFGAVSKGAGIALLQYLN